MKKDFKEALYSTNLKDIEKNLSQFLQFKKQESLSRHTHKKDNAEKDTPEEE